MLRGIIFRGHSVPRAQRFLCFALHFGTALNSHLRPVHLHSSFSNPVISCGILMRISVLGR